MVNYFTFFLFFFLAYIVKSLSYANPQIPFSYLNSLSPCWIWQSWLTHLQMYDFLLGVPDLCHSLPRPQPWTNNLILSLDKTKAIYHEICHLPLSPLLISFQYFFIHCRSTQSESLGMGSKNLLLNILPMILMWFNIEELLANTVIIATWFPWFWILPVSGYLPHIKMLPSCFNLFSSSPLHEECILNPIAWDPSFLFTNRLFLSCLLPLPPLRPLSDSHVRLLLSKVSYLLVHLEFTGFFN